MLILIENNRLALFLKITWSAFGRAKNATKLSLVRVF